MSSIFTLPFLSPGSRKNTSAHHEGLSKKKELILDRMGSVKGDNILEVGFGNCALLDELHLRGANVHGIDISASVVSNAKKKPYARHLCKAAAQDISAMFPNTRFDTIIASSVIHDIHAYGNHMDPLYCFLTNAQSASKIEGKLVIQESIIPEDADQEVVVSFSSEWNRRASKYAQQQTFGNSYDMEKTGKTSWRGTLRAAMEMIGSIHRGHELINRKSHELDHILSERNFLGLLENLGFEVESEPFIDPEYLNISSCHVKLSDIDGNEIPFPSTCSVITAKS